ncbi:MAG: MotA/TolQ/ExbB proton channel family protein [Planctomycetota bacterium]
MLEWLASQATYVILIAAAVHVVGFFVLMVWARGIRRSVAQTLERFTAGLPHRSRMDWHVSLSDQIEAFLADIHDALASDTNSVDRQSLSQRLRVLDERRDYLQSMRFETAWSVARSMIEAYPLAGVLGTILAIGAALSADETASVTVIVDRFGDAIWSTFAGLASAIGLMLLASFVEPSFARLTENRSHVRETTAKAKRELPPTNAPNTADSMEPGP